jgi:trk system potassium uptake protein
VQVLVIGCGRVGSALARNIIATGHEVTVIDRSRSALGRLGDGFPGRTIVGVGFDRETLREAGIADAVGVAAVTSGDNTNILCARVAREHFGIERVVARIYDPRRAAVYQRLGIPTVASVTWTSDRILRRVLPDQPAVEWSDPSASVSIVERQLPSGWSGRLVAELAEVRELRLVAIGRLGAALLPSADLVLQDGDVAYCAVRSEHVTDVDSLLTAPASKH